MISVTSAVRTVLPLVPEICSWYVPVATFLFVLTVSVEVPALTMTLELNFPTANFGKPLIANVTDPEKP